MGSLASLSTTSEDTVAMCSMTDNRQVISWARLEDESSRDSTTSTLVKLINTGIPDNRDMWPDCTRDFYRVKSDLSTIGPVVLVGDRVAIPSSLQSEVLEVLHSAHQGTTSMTNRALSCIYWPGMLADISRKRAACSSCDKSAPSQPSAPPTPPSQPSYPFEMICSDYFSLHGRKYLIIVDRYSGWLSVYDTGKTDGANGLISALKTHFSTFGISTEVASDGGPEYTAAATQRFMKDWGVHHRQSSAYFAHSNQRAESGVKSAKRMLRENVSNTGTLDTDKFRRALLNHRNTPDRDTGVSPAQIVFGRPIRDFIPIKPGLYQPRQEWILTRERRELALARRHVVQERRLTEHTKTLPKLKVSDVVMIQNQSGPHPLKWDRSGMVVEVLPFDQYKVKMDGSGRLSLRNRKFLRPITPFTTGLSRQANTILPPSSPLPTLPHTAEPAPAPSHHQPAEEQHQITGGRGEQTQTGPVPQTEEQADTPDLGDQEVHAPQHGGIRRSGRERRLPMKLQDYEL